MPASPPQLRPHARDESSPASTMSLRIPGRIDPERLESWRRAADDAGMTLSAFVREAVDAEVRRRAEQAGPLAALDELLERSRSGIVQ